MFVFSIEPGGRQCPLCMYCKRMGHTQKDSTFPKAFLTRLSISQNLRLLNRSFAMSNIKNI